MSGRGGPRKGKAKTESRWRRALPMAGLAGVVGLGAGMIIAGFVAGLSGGQARANWVIWFFPLVTGLAGWVVGAQVIERTGDLAQRIFMGSEVGTRADYSVAEGLEVRGEYEAAVQAYANGAKKEPEDPTPRIRGAVLLRDRLERPEQARAWLEMAREVGPLTKNEQVTIAMELAELYEHHLEQPERAEAELVAIFREYHDTNLGPGVAKRIRELRRRIKERGSNVG